MVLREKYENAVSPVVGVMLMLVVVIIVASAVTIFAAGLMEESPSSATSLAKVEFVGADTNIVGLVFKNTGGGTLDMRDLQLHAEDGSGSFTVAYHDRIWVEKYKPEQRIKPRAKLGGDLNLRMVKYGSDLTVEERENPIVEAGEAFIIYGESYNSFVGMGFAPLGEKGDGSYGAIGSGAVKIDDTTIITLKNVDTGQVYVEQRLSKGDILAK